MAQRRKISRICALYKSSTDKRAWKAIGDKLHAPSYLFSGDQYWKIRTREIEIIGKYSFVNGSITDCTKLPEAVVFTSHGKAHISKIRFR